MEILAFYAGYKYFQFLKRKRGDNLSGTNRAWVLAGAIFGALIGSRLLGGLENFHLLRQSNNMLIYFYMNKTVVGGFLGGLFGVEWIKKIIGEKKSSGDLFVKPIMLGGGSHYRPDWLFPVWAYKYEETYGIPTAVPWGMNLGDELSRHPVAIYEIIFLALLWSFIGWIERKGELRTGAAFKIFMIAYLLFRFTLDFIKPHYSLILDLSVIQNWLVRVALFIIAGRYGLQKDCF